ncbi:MAG: addiction module antidote protein, HigA family [Anaerolinea sp.]|nr:addiction module antidote protein, HigA family [Anaerolinea sp.]
MATDLRLHSDLAIPPGEYVAEELALRGMSQRELAESLGWPPRALSGFIRGKRRVSADMAIDLERVLGTPAHVWLGLQSEYDLITAVNRRGARATAS